MKNTPGTSDYIRIPPDLLTGSFDRDFLERFARVHVRREADGGASITTDDKYRHTRPPGVDSVLIARGTAFDADAMHQLGMLTPVTGPTSAEELERLRVLRGQFRSTQTDPEPLWARFAGEVQLAAESDLIDLLQDIQAAGGPTDSIWILTADKVFSQRLAVMRAMFAARHAREAFTPSDLHEGFPAGRSLMMNSIASFSRYLHPPFLYGSPWVWSSVTVRANTTFVRLIESPERGRPLGWGTPMDQFKGRMYEGRGIPPMPREPTESIETRERFMCWWADRVGSLVDVLADFTRYRDGDGDYRPELHFGTVLTVERLFALAVESMQLRTTDEMMRILLLFDVLDLLDGQHLGTHEQNLDHGRQHEAWSNLQLRLPLPVRDCIFPLVEEAFDALRQVDETLWARSRRSGDTVVIDRKDGRGQENIRLDRARGEYLRILRDSHHGFRKLVSNNRDLSYLACFTGELSTRLPDLIWWYLIRLLDNPMALVSAAFASERQRP